ncbi:MAG: hypothetical protein I3270_01720 [Candidatus Moeniiplasma glomeromycotorum]|nr:hypothetical protein [Candidatus Moeniiplasma glomeromycotorum]MCE8162425.1 hypothetical protein [Candidatus Moeniiplasma glomeromycotorum]MCE8166351.1 hypothetical protein [Candidatus Moeniiplasma glomeromycotorum]MCE8166833.1 hypothetical protein [Candidatus Moeniiplasma glomeromycotorum]
MVKKYIETGIKPNDNGWVDIDLSKLRADYEKIRQRLIEWADNFLTVKQKEKELEETNKLRNDLQTKYDMAVKSKEELVKIKIKLEQEVLTENDKNIISKLYLFTSSKMLYVIIFILSFSSHNEWILNHDANEAELRQENFTKSPLGVYPNSVER